MGRSGIAAMGVNGRIWGIIIALALMAVALAPLALAAEDDPALDPTGKPDHFTGEPIKDKRFAVVVIKEGEPVYFRDIGSAFKWRAGECIATQVVCDASTWAFDFLSGRRLHMRAGYYVISPAIATPSGHGVAVFVEEGDARDALKRYGGKGVYDFEQAQAYFR